MSQRTDIYTKKQEKKMQKEIEKRFVSKIAKPSNCIHSFRFHSTKLKENEGFCFICGKTATYKLEHEDSVVYCCQKHHQESLTSCKKHVGIIPPCMYLKNVKWCLDYQQSEKSASVEFDGELGQGHCRYFQRREHHPISEGNACSICGKTAIVQAEPLSLSQNHRKIFYFCEEHKELAARGCARAFVDLAYPPCLTFFKKKHCRYQE